MSDLISRQAAIDALDKRFDDVPMELTTEILQLRRDLRERIPSAQPPTNCSEIPNNSDTISRQAAIDALIRKIRPHNNGDGTITMWVMSEELVRETLKEVPSAQPERKTGKWLPDNRPGGGFWVCSCCKFPSEAFAANVLYKFCPNCGAYMGGDEGV